MKARLHKLPLHNDVSFLYSQWECPYFDKPWHFHEEYELVLIDKSRGTKFIGDSVSLFEEGDLFLIGSNIPHLFRNDETYYTDSPGAHSVFIHFTQDLFGDRFLSLPELKGVHQLLDQSAFALEVHGQTRKEVTEQLHQMQTQSPPKRLLSLLDILLTLSESRELKPLLSTRFAPNHNINTKDTLRIQKVLEYIMKNYMNDIYISEVAAMLNMSEAAFSRYFKHHTQKTYTSYLTEVRISNACRLLMQGEESISEIGYGCGFENLSNFYRHFKKVTGFVPKDYRRQFLKIATGAATATDL